MDFKLLCSAKFDKLFSAKGEKKLAKFSHWHYQEKILLNENFL